MVNGFTQKDVPDSAIYYDIPEYRTFWATVAELDVPFYLHPRMQIPSRAQNYEGHPWLMSAPWGFAVETSIHSLRLCGSGVFDDYPSLKIVIGHLGEFIPHALWRIDAQMRYSPRGYRGSRPLGEVFLDHFLVTTSGFFNDPAFKNTLEVMGTDADSSTKQILSTSGRRVPKNRLLAPLHVVSPAGTVSNPTRPRAESELLAKTDTNSKFMNNCG